MFRSLLEVDGRQTRAAGPLSRKTRRGGARVACDGTLSVDALRRSHVDLGLRPSGTLIHLPHHLRKLDGATAVGVVRVKESVHLRDGCAD
eukprot:482096-Prymnesium_polylepis.1